jgi:glycine/betaine/sarcosine/D-proline reductase family selenoprotein B
MLGKEIDRAGIPAVVVTSLQDVAVQFGANRILRTYRSSFHHPFGVPDMGLERERAWRRGAVEAALKALQTPIEGPRVFDY